MNFPLKYVELCKHHTFILKFRTGHRRIWCPLLLASFIPSVFTYMMVLFLKKGSKYIILKNE